MARRDAYHAMGMGEAMIVAGIGSRKGVEAAEVIALIARALAEASLVRSDLTALATVDGKAAEPGLVAAAASLGLELQSLSTAVLQVAEGGQTTSSCSARIYGVSSVSEAAALAAAGAGSELILSRIKSAKATCALARSTGGGAP